MEVTDEMLAQALDALAETGGYSDEFPAFGDDLSSDDRLDVLAVLLARDWVTAKTNYGDNRLYSVRALRMTPAGTRGHAALLIDDDASAGDSKVRLTLDEKRALRLQIMTEIYAASDGSMGVVFRSDELVSSHAWPRGPAREAIAYLKQEGLLRAAAWGAVSITHAGVVEVEQSLTSPDLPTDHFPASTNIITVHASVIGSSLQQAGAARLRPPMFSVTTHAKAQPNSSRASEQRCSRCSPRTLERMTSYRPSSTSLTAGLRQRNHDRPASPMASAASPKC